MIFEALRGWTFHEPANGLVRITGYLSGEAGAAFLRAVGRVDEEFLARDIRDGQGMPHRIRTDDQRRHDALIELIDRAAAALGIVAE